MQLTAPAAFGGFLLEHIMAAEDSRVPVIAGIGVGTAWALHALVHAGWLVDRRGPRADRGDNGVLQNLRGGYAAR